MRSQMPANISSLPRSTSKTNLSQNPVKHSKPTIHLPLWKISQGHLEVIWMTIKHLSDTWQRSISPAGSTYRLSMRCPCRGNRKEVLKPSWMKHLFQNSSPCIPWVLHGRRELAWLGPFRVGREDLGSSILQGKLHALSSALSGSHSSLWKYCQHRDITWNSHKQWENAQKHQCLHCLTLRHAVEVKKKWDTSGQEQVAAKRFQGLKWPFWCLTGPCSTKVRQRQLAADEKYNTLLPNLWVTKTILCPDFWWE